VGGRRTNLTLLVVLGAALASGTVAYALGAASGRAVVIAHGAAGLGLVVLSPWKAALSGRSLRRRSRGRAPSLALAALVVTTVVSGLAHSAGVRRLPVVATAMHLHVGAALAAIPLAAWHVAARPVRARRADVSRRDLLRAGGVAAGAGVLWLAGEAAHRALGLRGAERRFTGSHAEGTDDPVAMPVIQWLTDDVQRLDAGAWRLDVVDGTRRTLDLDGLRGLGADEVRATLDCTSGWYATQTWRGVRLDRLLAPGAADRSLVVASVTGYARRFPLRDLDRLWLADGYAGVPLAAAHGAPVRLVAPGRRGFWWVKWVTQVRLDDVPWWRQPPFPLQ
jgi:DMSO/TMAO reductase YedYZ molybdopterin-dependent catalytic subunit